MRLKPRPRRDVGMFRLSRRSWDQDVETETKFLLFTDWKTFATPLATRRVTSRQMTKNDNKLEMNEKLCNKCMRDDDIIYYNIIL